MQRDERKRECEMKQLRKLISAVTALAMTAAMFAGLSINASAKTSLIDETFDGSQEAYWTNVSNNITAAVESGSLKFVNTSTGTPRETDIALDPTTEDSEFAEISFDFQTHLFDTAYTDITHFQFEDSAGNAIFKLELPPHRYGSAVASMNEETLEKVTLPEKADSPWYTVKAILNFKDNVFDYTVCKQGSDEVLAQGTDVTMLSDASDVSTMNLRLNRNGNGTPDYVLFDNFSLAALDGPAVDVSGERVEVDIDQTVDAATVSGAVSVTATSENEDVATAVYDNGTVKITGVSAGQTNVNIVAVSADGVAVRKTVEVISGGVELVDISVKYIYNGEEIAAGYGIEDIAVGTVIPASEVRYESAISNADYRYTNPSVEDYTVVSGENTIEVVYADRQAAVSDITVEYKNGGSVIATKTETVPAGYYEGDSYTYTSTNYVTDEDGTIYAVGIDYVDDAGSQDINSSDDNNPVNKEIRQTVELTSDTVLSYDVKVSPSAIYYAEFEDALDLEAVDRKGSRYVSSGGKMTSIVTDGREFYPITTTGYYQIIVVTGPKNRGTEIFASAAEARAAAEYGKGLVSVKGSNNDAYGAYAAKTVLLEEGDNLAIRGWGGDGKTTDNLDYIVIRRIVTGDVIGPDGMTILPGGQSAEYTFDSGVVGDVVWNITGVEGVTVENGVVTVAENAEAGTATLTAVIGEGETAVSGSKEITIAQPQITGFDFNGASSVTVGADTTYSILNVKDQFGKIITANTTASYTSSDPDVISIDSETGVAKANAVGSATITVDITAGTAASQKSIDVKVEKFYALADATGNTTVVDLTGMVENEYITGYKVTTADADGNLVKEYIADVNDVQTVASKDAITITATYNEDGTLNSAVIGSVSAGEAVPQSEGARVFVWDAFNSMVPVDVVNGLTVDTTGAAKVEVSPVFTYTYEALSFDGEGHQLEGAFADGRYNFEITKSNLERTDVYVNDYMIANNIDQYGDGRQMTDKDKVYKATDMAVHGGTITVRTEDYAGSGTGYQGAWLDKIVVDKAPDIVNRVPKVYVVGDSLVADYYGETSNLLGSSQTGWGQALKNFVTDDYEVVNWANSGTIARTILATSYVGVLNSAKPGDYLIIESGYNDANAKNDTTPEQFKDYIQQMIDGCEEYGIIPIIVSPNASNHDFRVNVAYAVHMREVAEANPDVLFIDLATLSYNYLYELYDGDADKVLKNFNVPDQLHSSYLGAMKYAEIVAQAMHDDGIGFIDTDYSWSIEDTEGNPITVQVK